MVLYPDVLYYACIAIVLAEFSSRDETLGDHAAKCLDQTPAFHSTFSHTGVSQRLDFKLSGVSHSRLSVRRINRRWLMKTKCSRFKKLKAHEWLGTGITGGR